MSRLSKQVENDKKVAELHSKVNAKAKELQNVIESIDSANKDLDAIKRQKATLSKTLVDLEQKIKGKEEFFSNLKDRELSFVNSIKQEFNKENLSLKEKKELLRIIEERIDEASVAKGEIENLLSKESNIRVRFTDLNEKLVLSEKKYVELEQKSKLENESILKVNEHLDAYKQYLTDLYGKLASYVAVAKETLTVINEGLKENGTPIVFNIPDGQIVEIDIDNFTKHIENHE